MEYDKCPICSSPAIIDDKTYKFETYLIVKCYRCGKYEIDEEVIEFEIDNDKLSSEQIANISGWIRENQGSIINLTKEKFKPLKTLKTLTVSEKADKIFKYLSTEFPIAGKLLNIEFSAIGDIININDFDLFQKSKKIIAKNLLPLISIGRIIDKDEFIFIIEAYLGNEKGYLSDSRLKITPKGWAYLESLRQLNPDSKKAFVAMWFTPKMEKIYDDYIQEAIKDAGYEPIQIGRKKHNNDINDEIIGEIRNSKFVVADFTGNRGGVYYEAGFAYGLKKDVIYLCRKDWWDKVIVKKIKAELKNKKKEFVKIKEKRKVHFDLNHKSFIIWKDGKDLYDQLFKKIKATIH